MSPKIVINADLTPLGSTQQAIAIDDHRIAGVIPMAEVSSIRFADYEMIDAGGATVFPGIDDSHLHGYEYGRSLTAHDLRESATLSEFQDRLPSARPEANGWVRGYGWNGSFFSGSGPNGSLSAADVDLIISDVPAILSDVSGHQTLCNSLALRLAGVSSTTEDPSGGSFVRDEHGNPTGLVLEAAIGIINDAIPQLNQADQRSAILAAQESLLSQGITAYTDPGLGPGARTLMGGTGDIGAVDAYRKLDAGGALAMRVNVMLLYGGLGGTKAEDLISGLDQFGGPVQGGEFGHLDIAQVKVFADGIPRSRTAWISDPYDDHTCGHLQVAGNTDEERIAELTNIIHAATSRGWQVGAHSIGDRTISAFLDAIFSSGTWPDLRHYVIHGDLVEQKDLARMATMGIALNTNPSIRWMTGRSVSPYLGEERNLGKQPMQTAIKQGVRVMTSSDAPVMPPEWTTIMAASMTRSLRTDPDYTDNERLNSRQAVEALTTNSAWQSNAENWRGSLSEGMAADLVILDRAVDWSNPWSLNETQVRMTMVGGKVVFGGQG